MAKNIIVGFCIFLMLLLGNWIFYEKEIKYLLPTPIPENYHPIAIMEEVKLPVELQNDITKPLLLHFFNPNCTCSNFNIDHYISLVKKYQSDIHFITLLQINGEAELKEVEKFKAKYPALTNIVVDHNGKIAATCGVYSTPQAVLLNADNQLFYRGNYNRARFCGASSTAFARIAIDSLLIGSKPPTFAFFGDLPYGCELPQTNYISSEIFKLID